MKTLSSNHLMPLSLTLACLLAGAAPMLAGAAPMLVAAAPSASDPEQVEVPVRRVMFPVRGYDDNDNVQLLVEGELPDPCYVLGRQRVDVDASGTITVHQLAWRRSGGACDSGDLLGTSPFSEEVSLGRLKAGQYRVAYAPDDQSQEFRDLSVGVAPVATMDDFNYARVTDLQVPDVVLQGQKAQVRLSGPFASSCNRLKEPVAVERIGDTFVIRPIELQLGDCGWSLRTFVKTIDLGALPPGEYLVHVRSKNGRAVERTFSVLRSR
jgi:hypothetical protein